MCSKTPKTLNRPLKTIKKQENVKAMQEHNKKTLKDTPQTFSKPLKKTTKQHVKTKTK